MADKVPSLERSMESMVHTIHGISQDELLPRPRIGVVLAPPPAIQIRVDNITLEQKDCYIFHYSMPGYTRHMVGATSYRGGGSGDPAYESHNHPIDNDETWTDTLVPGDLVGVIPLEESNDGEKKGQLYLITGRLKKL